jgi:hypothetical protein
VHALRFELVPARRLAVCLPAPHEQMSDPIVISDSESEDVPPQSTNACVTSATPASKVARTSAHSRKGPKAMQHVPVRQVASTAGKGVNDMQSIPGGYAVAVFHCVVPRNVNPMTAQGVSVQKAEFHVREPTASDASRRCVWLTIQIETEAFEIEVRTM